MNAKSRDDRQFSLFDEAPTREVATGSDSNFLQNMKFRDIVNVCEVFRQHHFHWPKIDSTVEQFVEAGVNSAAKYGISGQSLSALALKGSPVLDQDPKYIEVRDRTLREFGSLPNLSCFNPEYYRTLEPQQIESLVNSIEIELWDGKKREKFNENHLRLNVSPFIRERVLTALKTQGGSLPGSLGVSFGIPREGVLSQAIVKSGLIYGSELPDLNERYIGHLEERAWDAGVTIFRIGYQTLSGGRNISEVPPSVLEGFINRSVKEIARQVSQHSLGAEAMKILDEKGEKRSVNRSANGCDADPLMSGLMAIERLTGDIEQKLTQINDQLGLPREPDNNQAKQAGSCMNAGDRNSAVLNDLMKLQVTDQGISLPEERLRSYKDIKALLEKAGGRYVQNKQFFKFEDGIDFREVLETLRAGGEVNFKQEYQFFGTARKQAVELCLAAGPLEGLDVLEPSAGDGALADVAREMGAARITTVELWSVNAIKLRNKGYDPIERDFLQVTPEEIGQFDAIIANPPFSDGQDIDHVLHMTKFLKPGGSLSTIMWPGWLTGNQRKHEMFREFLTEHGAKVTKIEAGAFSKSGTTVSTVRVDFRNFRPELNLTNEESRPKRRMMRP